VPRALLWPMRTVPPSRVVPPEYVLLPESVSVPSPILLSAPLPDKTPDHVVPSPLVSMVEVVPLSNVALTAAVNAEP